MNAATLNLINQGIVRSLEPTPWEDCSPKRLRFRMVRQVAAARHCASVSKRTRLSMVRTRWAAKHGDVIA